ncbi:hypothetical protein H5410_027267 [Solanum commersonii]|uniref:Uncharacterized protein n=1 Tax=Solanum commersonii TaxID=4109 RepID=A0A9J5Z1H9_SOLCO|nr:hypothetical protein H5410_027267 [Solanum commersonii]
MGKNYWILLQKRFQEYGITPQKGIITDSSVKHIARKISVQDIDKEEMINNYIEEVKRSLLLNLTQYEKSDTSLRNESSDDAIDDIQEAQPVEKTMKRTNCEDVSIIKAIINSRYTVDQ